VKAPHVWGRRDHRALKSHALGFLMPVQYFKGLEYYVVSNVSCQRVSKHVRYVRFSLSSQSYRHALEANAIVSNA